MIQKDSAVIQDPVSAIQVFRQALCVARAQYNTTEKILAFLGNVVIISIDSTNCRVRSGASLTYGAEARVMTKKAIFDAEVESSGANEIASQGVKGVVGLTRDAMGQAPPWMRGIIYVAGIGAILCVVSSLFFILTRESAHGFSILLCGFGLLALAIVAFSIILLNKSGEGVPEQPVQPRFGLVWNHFESQIRNQGQTDLSIDSFFCPDSTPTTISRLGVFSILNMWADPRGSSVNVNLVESDSSPYLDLQFFNSPRGWPCAVTIRPAGLKPYKREKGFNFLTLEARVPAPQKKDCLGRVSIRFRILDRLGTDWYRGRGENDYLIQCVEFKPGNEEWSTLSIPLTDGMWKVFSAYGNHRYPRPEPDISDVLLALVVELGADRGNERPGPGKGRIWLRNIRFSECGI